MSSTTLAIDQAVSVALSGDTVAGLSAQLEAQGARVPDPQDGHDLPRHLIHVAERTQPHPASADGLLRQIDALAFAVVDVVGAFVDGDLSRPDAVVSVVYVHPGDEPEERDMTWVALRSAVRCLATELGPHGTRINLLRTTAPADADDIARTVIGLMHETPMLTGTVVQLPERGLHQQREEDNR